MLNQVKQFHSRCGEFCVPEGHLNNAELIKRRIEEVPTTSQSALRHVLSYLYPSRWPHKLA